MHATGSLGARGTGAYKIDYTPGDNPDLPYHILPGKSKSGSSDFIGPCFSRREAQTLVLGVNLLLKLVEIGSQRELPYGALADAHERDNLARAEAQQKACEEAISRYQDILRQSEAGPEAGLS